MVTVPSHRRPIDSRPPTLRAPLQRAARGGVLNLVSAVVSAVASFGLTIAVTRAFSLDVAGVFFATSSVLVLVSTVGRLGTDTSLVYFLSRCRALGRHHEITSYVRVALRPVTVIGIGSGIALFVAAPVLARWIAVDNVDLATTYLRVFAVFMPFATVEYVVLAATRGLGTMKPNAVVEQLIRPGLQLLLVIAAVLISSANLLPWAWGIGYVLATALSMWWWRRLRKSRGIVAGRQSVGTEFWRFSTPRSLTGAAQVGMQRLDIILVAVLAGVGPAAIYTATTRFIVLGQMARNAVSQAVQPPLAEALARHDNNAANNLYQASTAWLIMTSWPVYLVLATVGGPLLKVFGHHYQDGALLLLVLSLGMLVAIGCGDVDIVLVMAGRPTWSMWNIFLAFGTNIGLDLWLIPAHGVLGAAIGWSVAMVIKNVTAMVQVAALMKLHPLGRSTLAAAACAIVAFAVLPIAVKTFSGSDTQQFVLAVGAGAVAYAALLWRFRSALGLSNLMNGLHEG